MTEQKKEENWESRAIQDLLQANLKEQRHARRWKIFFRLLMAGYIGFALIALILGVDPRKEDTVAQKHVAVVDVRGEIADGSRDGASAERIIKGLQDAFKAENAVGVILHINSPGGSPVQSAQVYREIMRLRQAYPERPVYAVASDIAASGAYYIASAADYIYADPTSLVGSVGVIMGGFGFSDIMSRVGVERRVYTAGKHKSFMDPFSVENTESIAHVNTMLADIHREFITAVREGRGDRIKGSDEELFNGLIWTGNQALEFGLIDGLGSPREVALNELGVSKMVNYSYSPSALERLADRVSASFAGELISAVGGNWQLR